MNKLERNKRLGQYFTSPEVAKLLVELALGVKPNITKAIDPMMGKGAFLNAINAIDPSIETHGIELDVSLADFVKTEFNSNPNLIFGNVFESNVNGQLNNQYDLVITNPPYVRHLNQTGETVLEKDLTVPSGYQVRANLIKSIEANSDLSDAEREILIEATKNYSGLSDLSVPSIIQCASLTKNNGILALLIPESCISREYSITTLNILFKLFDVKLIVKDEGRSWFDDAQVKTLLIVAQKLGNPRKNILLHSKIPIVEIPQSSPESPLGEKFTSSNYKDFASVALDSKSANNLNHERYYLPVRFYLLQALSKNNLSAYPEFKELSIRWNQIDFIDPRLSDITSCTEFVRLDEISINIHQGLRTGANKFFYCDLIKKGSKSSLVAFEIKGEKKEIQIPNHLIKPVLRKQKELQSESLIRIENLKGRLIYLKNSYTLSDVNKYKLNKNAKKLPVSLSDYIEYCSEVNIGSAETPKFFPLLSAVKTNVSTNNGTIKTWYQIPELKERHLPDICIPRVNSNIAKSFAVEKGVVVDANFITLNISQNSQLNKFSLLALLNSAWTSIQLELNGNILGGGALKLDRSHLQNLAYPKNIALIHDDLEKLGQKLIESPKNKQVQSEINHLVNSTLNIKNTNKLNSLLKNRLKLRTNNV